jgi:hypothetical protein
MGLHGGTRRFEAPKEGMTMTRTIIIAALAGMLVATPAVANEGFTGNVLDTLCQESFDWCAGYAAGVLHGVRMGQMRDAVCLPKNVTVGQVRDVITKYLRDHPEIRHYAAGPVAAVAINNAWPNACKGE